MTAPAVAAQLASEWQLTPAEIGYLFSAELGAMSLATLPHGGDESSELAPRGPVRLRGISRRQSCFGGGQSVRNAADRPLHRLAGGGTLMILCISCAAGDGQSFPGVCLLGAGTAAAGNGGTAGVTRAVCQFWPEGGVPDPRRYHALLSAAGPGFSPNVFSRCPPPACGRRSPRCVSY